MPWAAVCIFTGYVKKNKHKKGSRREGEEGEAKVAAETEVAKFKSRRMSWRAESALPVGYSWICS